MIANAVGVVVVTGKTGAEIGVIAEKEVVVVTIITVGVEVEVETEEEIGVEVVAQVLQEK